jgi:hypothetical protein
MYDDKKIVLSKSNIALKRKRLLGYYIDRIHTSRDIMLDHLILIY